MPKVIDYAKQIEEEYGDLDDFNVKQEDAAQVAYQNFIVNKQKILDLIPESKALDEEIIKLIDECEELYKSNLPNIEIICLSKGKFDIDSSIYAIERKLQTAVSTEVYNQIKNDFYKINNRRFQIPYSVCTNVSQRLSRIKNKFSQIVNLGHSINKVDKILNDLNYLDVKFNDAINDFDKLNKLTVIAAALESFKEFKNNISDSNVLSNSKSHDTITIKKSLITLKEKSYLFKEYADVISISKKLESSSGEIDINLIFDLIKKINDIISVDAYAGVYPDPNTLGGAISYLDNLTIDYKFFTITIDALYQIKYKEYNDRFKRLSIEVTDMMKESGAFALNLSINFFIEMTIRLLKVNKESPTIISMVETYKDLANKRLENLLAESKQKNPKEMVEAHINNVIIESIKRKDKNVYFNFGNATTVLKLMPRSRLIGYHTKGIVIDDIKKMLGIDASNADKLISEESYQLISKLLMSPVDNSELATTPVYAKNYKQLFGDDGKKLSQRVEEQINKYLLRNIHTRSTDIDQQVVKTLIKITNEDSNRILINYILSSPELVNKAYKAAKIILEKKVDPTQFAGLVSSPSQFINLIDKINSFEQMRPYTPKIISDVGLTKIDKNNFEVSLNKFYEMMLLVHNNSLAISGKNSRIFDMEMYLRDKEREYRAADEGPEALEDYKKKIEEEQAALEVLKKEFNNAVLSITFNNKNFKNIKYDAVKKFFKIAFILYQYDFNYESFYKSLGNPLKGLSAKKIVMPEREFKKEFDDFVSMIKSNKEINTLDDYMKQKINSFLYTLNTLKDAEAIEEYVYHIEDKVPELNILNKNYKNYRFRVLEQGDTAALSKIGQITDCCQQIGGIGNNAAVDSFINKNAGVLVLEVKDESKDNWEIAAQSYFHYVPGPQKTEDSDKFVLDWQDEQDDYQPSKSNHSANGDPNGPGFILDNVEYAYNTCKKYRLNLEEIYNTFAKDIVSSNPSIKYIYCGTDLNKLNNDAFESISYGKEKDYRRFHPKIKVPYTDVKGEVIDLLKLKERKNSVVETKKENRVEPLELSLLNIASRKYMAHVKFIKTAMLLNSLSKIN